MPDLLPILPPNVTNYVGSWLVFLSSSQIPTRQDIDSLSITLFDCIAIAIIIPIAIIIGYFHANSPVTSWGSSRDTQATRAPPPT